MLLDKFILYFSSDKPNLSWLLLGVEGSVDVKQWGTKR